MPRLPAFRCVSLAYRLTGSTDVPGPCFSISQANIEVCDLVVTKAQLKLERALVSFLLGVHDYEGAPNVPSEPDERNIRVM